MDLGRFLSERSPDWHELDALVREAGRRADKLGPERVRRLGALYRATAADLALARRRFRGDPVVAQLADRVGRARHLVYGTEARRSSLWQFVSRGYWRRVRERPVPLAVAVALLVVPAVLGTVWAHADPAAAVGVLPGMFRRAGRIPRRGASTDVTTAFSSVLAVQIFTNNITVALQAFAGGLLAGFATIYVMIQNGVVLGVLAALTFDAGSGSRFVALVAPHGVLELSCIAVAGAAGLRFGWALVAPGRRSRRDAIVEEGRSSVELALGTAGWLIVAGLVEGFITPKQFDVGSALIVGGGLGAIFWGLVVWRGGPERVPEPARL